MGRPTKFSDHLADGIADLVSADATRAEACATVGIGVRTLATWINRGWNGEPPYADWFEHFAACEQRSRRRRFNLQARKERALARARYRQYRDARERWWLEQLGPVEFWRRRLDWARSRGNDTVAARAEAELEAAILVERR